MDAQCPASSGRLGTHVVGDLPLSGGGSLRDARLVYSVHGTLSPGRDNCIVFPTYYTGTHASNERMIGPGRALDPSRWFIVVPNLFGNGVSTSPSNAAAGQRGAAFPGVSVADNVRAQADLVFGVLGVERVRLVTGWSLGAVQAIHWAVAQSDRVDALFPFCGSARCSPHNRVFIEGLRACLRADPHWRDGDFSGHPEAGLRAFGRVYAGWAYSQAFFREGLHARLGHADIESFLTAWEDEHLVWNAHDLLAKLWTWEHADPALGGPFAGSLAAALGSIRARTIVMACDQDLYFTVADNAAEAALIPGAELRVLRSAFGHCAGAPGRFAECMAEVEAALHTLLG